MAIPSSKLFAPFHAQIRGTLPFNMRDWSGLPTNTANLDALKAATGKSFQQLLDAGVLIQPGLYTVG